MCSKWHVTLETVVYGAFTGLASTGLHQAFTRLINKRQRRVIALFYFALAQLPAERDIYEDIKNH